LPEKEIYFLFIYEVITWEKRKKKLCYSVVTPQLRASPPVFWTCLFDESVSANGNPKAKVAVVYKGLGGEQRTEVCEGGMSIEQALCGRVRLSRRDASP